MCLACWRTLYVLYYVSTSHYCGWLVGWPSGRRHATLMDPHALSLWFCSVVLTVRSTRRPAHEERETQAVVRSAHSRFTHPQRIPPHPFLPLTLDPCPLPPPKIHQDGRAIEEQGREGLMARDSGAFPCPCIASRILLFAAYLCTKYSAHLLVSNCLPYCA